MLLELLLTSTRTCKLANKQLPRSLELVQVHASRRRSSKSRPITPLRRVRHPNLRHSATAVAIEDLRTIFGVYVLGGFFITAAAAVNISWIHRSFQVVVYWTVTMAMIWFGARGKEILAKFMKRD